MEVLILIQGVEDLERCHHDQQGNVHSELKKEMALLQKKILMDTVSYPTAIRSKSEDCVSFLPLVMC